MACAVRSLTDGSQQIVAIFVAGEMLNAGELFFPRSRTSILALTSAISLSIPLSPYLMRRVVRTDRLNCQRPRLGRSAMNSAIDRVYLVIFSTRNKCAQPSSGAISEITTGSLAPVGQSP
jgi:Cu/Ag efflux pump CusA